MGFVGNLLLFPVVKEFWKSVKIWRSYRHEFSGSFLFGHGEIVRYSTQQNNTLSLSRRLWITLFVNRKPCFHYSSRAPSSFTSNVLTSYSSFSPFITFYSTFKNAHLFRKSFSPSFFIRDDRTVAEVIDHSLNSRDRARFTVIAAALYRLISSVLYNVCNASACYSYGHV